MTAQIHAGPTIRVDFKCDDCGFTEPFEGKDFNEAFRASLKAAWIVPNPTTVDRIHICPECPEVRR
jgi:hypothetical protein